MAPDAPKVRLYVPDDLAAGGAVALAPGQAHYLRTVLRLGVGAEVALFNGRDGEWRARVERLAKGGAELATGERIRLQEDGPDLWLVFAPIKRARIDFVAEKATELGAAALWPVFTRRTAVARVNRDRLRANAVEAAEQCGRLSVPEIFEPVDLWAAMESWPTERALLLCDETGAGRPVARALAGADRAAPWAALVGPEGGFDASELDALRKLPFVTAVDLGPLTLRADTAALAVFACWQALAGT